MAAVTEATEDIDYAKIAKVPFPIIGFSSVWGLPPDNDFVERLKTMALKNGFFISTFVGTQIDDQYTTFGYYLYSPSSEKYAEDGSVRISCFQLKEGCSIYQEWINDIANKCELTTTGKTIVCPSDLDGYFLYEIKRAQDFNNNTENLIKKTYQLFGKEFRGLYTRSWEGFLGEEDVSSDFDCSSIEEDVKKIQDNSMITSHNIHYLFTKLHSLSKFIGTENEVDVLKYCTNLCAILTTKEVLSKLKPHPVSHNLVPFLVLELLKLVSLLKIGEEVIPEIKSYCDNIIEQDGWIKEKAIYKIKYFKEEMVFGPSPSFMGSNIATAKKIIDILVFGAEKGFWEDTDISGVLETLDDAFVSNPIFEEVF